MSELGSYFGGARGTAVLVDLRRRVVSGIHQPGLATRWLLPPGSTIKPFTLAALLDGGKLRGSESYSCPGKLMLRGRSFACSHPPLGTTLHVETALAYSCNCFVAHFAERFEPGELARYLVKARLAGEISAARNVVDSQLQAIGEERVAVTAAGLAAAYAELARRASGQILEGLEGAVEYGTAQAAAVRKIRVAGKTGSVVPRDGSHVAWFAGFAPSRSPEVAIAVAVQGRSGAADASPIAGRILEARFGGRL